MVVVVATCAVFSCSGRAPAPATPTPPPPKPPTGSGSATPLAKASEADCLAAIDHVIEVDLKDRPADQQLSAEQVAELRTTLRGSYLRECMDQPRAVVACITAASNRTAIKACDR